MFGNRLGFSYQKWQWLYVGAVKWVTTAAMQRLRHQRINVLWEESMFTHMRYDRMKIGVEIPTKFKFNDNTECWRSDDLSSEPERFHIFHDFYAALIRCFFFIAHPTNRLYKRSQILCIRPAINPKKNINFASQYICILMTVWRTIKSISWTKILFICVFHWISNSQCVMGISIYNIQCGSLKRLSFSIMSNIPTLTIKFSHGDMNKSLIMI